MTALAISLPHCPLMGTSLRDDLLQLARNAVARHQHRRLLRQLARYDARLLLDMGIDPDAVYGAVENSWDEFRPDMMLRTAPWI